MQNSIHKRLKILIDSLGLNYKEFSRKTGVPYTTVQDYLAGKRIPGGENLQKIAMQLHVNLHWLLTGKGKMFAKEKEKEKPSMVHKKSVAYGEDIMSTLEENNYVYVPMVSGKISAGRGLIPETSVEIKLAFRKDWIQKHGDPRNMSLIRVSGDSMKPTLYSGDIVLVDHNRNYIDPQGGIYAISMDDIIMIKRLQIIYTTKKIRIISDNPKYETFEAEPEQVIINGKIIWFGREIEK